MTTIQRRHVLAAPAALAVPRVFAAEAEDFARPPEPGPVLQPQWPAIAQFTLPNGLEVLCAERHAVPLVTATLVLRAGRETDPADAAGRAGLAATLLTRGARRNGRPVGAVQIARDAEALGGALVADAQWRHASLSTTVTVPRLPAALALLADCVRAPLFAPDELERARVQALDVLQVSLGSPAEVAGMVARRAFWGDTPPGRSPTARSVVQATADELRALHAAAMRPGRAVLVLAGDLRADDAKALAERHFGGWQAAAGEAFELPRVQPAPIEQPGVLVDMPGSGQCGVVLAAPFVAGDAEERAVADLASAVLGGGYSARLNQEVRIKRGLSYGVGGFGEPQAAAGAWFASAQTQHARAGDVLQLLRAEVLRLGREAPGAAELDARRATVIGRLVRTLQTTAGLAQVATVQRVQGRTPAELARQVAALQAVTPEQVRAFAERTWTDRTLRYAVAGDLAAAGTALADAAPGATRRRVEQLQFGAAF